MKKLSMKMAVVAILIFVGTMGVNAQIGKGGTCLGPGGGKNSGTCINNNGTCTVQLTEDQQAIIDALYADFQDAMDELREAMQAATSFAEKRTIWQEMADLRTAHIAEVQALLDDWGY